ncbi:hypothetical protein HU200_049170 [Digitaria exilis]|uniref:Uncharacterized protein n=1 Tax=Digitaria exilis TaxID=1010633 RepID=A0A835ARF8_9POAL|nr:hypothetical protein HU200_049170 [Digitaria exilis]CAB3471451.1 unnamed protein product [Digitaria exilis]
MSAAAAGDRPFLVVHDKEEGHHLVYDLLLLLLLEDGGEEDTMLLVVPRPVARFPSEWCLSFAVSGGSIVAAEYDWNSTACFYDAVMKAGGYELWERKLRTDLRDSHGRPLRRWPMGRGYKVSRLLGGSHQDTPAMLPLADGTVLRMDTVLFDGFYIFDRLLPGDGGVWHATALPNPPVTLAEDEITFISAYYALGTRVWISVSSKMVDKGTFSMDTAEQDGGGTWQKEGDWVMPFEGRAIYVPELGKVIGLTTEARLLCACDVNDDGTLPVLVHHVWTDDNPKPRDWPYLPWEHKSKTLPIVRHVWPDTFPRPCELEGFCISSSSEAKPRDMPSLAYLGKGRICICRPMSTMKPHILAPPYYLHCRILPGG